MSATVIAPPEAALTWELTAISAFDGMIRQIQADQYRRIARARALAVELEGVTDESTTAQRDLAERSFIAELATTLGQHETSAARMVAEAERLTGPRAATLEALERGDLGLTQVRSVLEFTQALPPAVADAVERVALDAAAASMNDGMVSTNTEVRRRMRRVRERLHPEALSDRRTRAADERRVCFDPAPDGMAWLSVLLEAERALAIKHRVDALAARDASVDTRSAVSQKIGSCSADSRTATQRAADIAADLLLGGSLADDERTRTHAGSTGAVRPRIMVTVPVMTLLGLSDEPAELEGYGPIDADAARRLAAHAPSIRRILVHPDTGAALSYGREQYRAPADLDGFVRARDGRCRFPGCSRRAEFADLDHTDAWAHGGSTEASNLAALCRHHHRLKHESGWRVVHEPGGVMRWTSPAGHLLRTLPERPFISVAAGDGFTSDQHAEARSSGAPLPDPIPPDPVGTFDSTAAAPAAAEIPPPF
ncbi:HNH endonuclease signature motif containing protein [Agromyces subbeticus]|uniref:HNH endonuclease signature motif containing protein n=1 Tax=Agromyces subbeticus TaxID=293890 RepID=UPI0003B44592|nr:HNH endonuclease signature motif containing protein [Agromyces subbeticus]